MIEIQDLKKSYGSFEALKGISFAAKQGEILGLLGPNGAGKTTTMKIITGFLDMDSGNVKVKKMNIRKNPQGIQKMLGYLPENAPLYSELNVYEHLEFSAKAHKVPQSKLKEAIHKAAKTCGLSQRLFFQISELSKGYKQRVGLAQALIHDPDVLILDEPTTGLDPNQIIEIRELIRSIGKKKTIILSTHIMQEVEAMCDHVIMLGDGKILASGSPQELKGGKNDKTVDIKVHVGGAKTAIKKALQIDGIQTVEHIGSQTRGHHQYVCTCEKDIRPQITKSLVKAEIEVYEIGFRENSMEQVFQKITQQ